MPIAEYDQWDATAMARQVRSGAVSASELVEEAIRRAEQHSSALNAIVHPLYDYARERAASEPGGPLAGVPFLLKDLQQYMAGVPMAQGSAALRGNVPAQDSALVERFRAAGLIVMGKTNVPELGLMGVTEPEAFGPARNPWDPGRTPGGSSGGSAAAVAAHIVPMAGANDGGGSIRIPASCCGLFGLKPTRGRVPTGPQLGDPWDGAAINLAVTHTVRDTAALLDAVCGPDVGAPDALTPPERPYTEEVGREVEPLRIGFSTDSPLDAGVDPACVKAVEETAALLEEMGHAVEPAAPEVDGRAVAECYLRMYFGQVGAELREMRARLGPRAVREGTEDTTRVLALIGETLSAADYVAGRRQWNTFGRACGRFHEEYDLYLTPTMAYPPVRIGQLAPSPSDQTASKVLNAIGRVAPRVAGRVLLASGIVDQIADENLGKVPFTQLANLTGQPAMSVPLHWTAGDGASDDGRPLPVGVHFTARFGAEDVLVRLAAALEKAQPWQHRHPPLVEG